MRNASSSVKLLRGTPDLTEQKYNSFQVFTEKRQARLCLIIMQLANHLVGAMKKKQCFLQICFG